MNCATCGHNICDPCWKARTKLAAELEQLSADLDAIEVQRLEFEKFLLWVERLHPHVIEEYKLAASATEGSAICDPETGVTRQRSAAPILLVPDGPRGLTGRQRCPGCGSSYRDLRMDVSAINVPPRPCAHHWHHEVPER